eukprot:3935845-Rhodomonas_salina.1
MEGLGGKGKGGRWVRSEIGRVGVRVVEGGSGGTEGVRGWEGGWEGEEGMGGRGKVELESGGLSLVTRVASRSRLKRFQARQYHDEDRCVELRKGVEMLVFEFLGRRCAAEAIVQRQGHTREPRVQALCWEPPDEK